MPTAKVFINGRSQAVKIPKEYRFDTDEVYITKIGDAVILTPVESLAKEFDIGAQMLPDDFLEDGFSEEAESVRAEL